MQAQYKLCRVKRVTRGPKGVPYAQMRGCMSWGGGGGTAERAQYPLIKEYTLNHTKDPYIN